MKLETFNKRVGDIAHNSKGYVLVHRLLMGLDAFGYKPYHKLWTCWVSGEGRYAKNLDYTDAVFEVLKRIGFKENIDFVFGNDAPRGGKPGNYVMLTAKGRSKMLTT